MNGSYQRSIVEKRDPIRGIIRLKTDLYPEFTSKFGVTYSVPAIHLALNLEGRYTGSRIAGLLNNFTYDPIHYRTRRYSLSSYFLADFCLTLTHLKIFGKGNDMEVRLKIFNIFNDTYHFPGFRDFDIRGLGRHYMLTITQKF